MTLERAWAVEPTAVRDELLEEGLVPRVEHGEDELYLFDTRERAERFAQDTLELFVKVPEGRADIWEVDVSGLAVTLIDDEEGPTALVKGSVAPSGLKLVHTIR